ncbi:taste receptor type 1 member 1-like [Solea solea]|uniref:taste receptor type 1 member 1-like n=1 Tax=Solea solea TaxID=90069 RepID=UPI00272D3150|nr:taste receptor type 1 member 1-like [Solea solea]
MMKRLPASLCLLGCILWASTQSTVSASEFHLEGDYLLGGLFNIHYISRHVLHDRPEGIDCSSQTLFPSNYRMFQLMRFAVEEINNSTSLLPNVSLGYEIFDYCSDTHNFPEMFDFLSVNDLTQARGEPRKQRANKANIPKVISVVGPFSSTQALTIAPLFMVDIIPVVSYGASSSVLSDKWVYPSFSRTVSPNADVIQVIIDILQHFKWHWVAFLNSDNSFGNDGLEMFINGIEDTDICLAYNKGLHENSNYSNIFRQIDEQQIHVIIVFAPKVWAEILIESAIQLNITHKVWIADDGWALHRRLPKMKGIRNIGTVLGISQSKITIPGFDDYIYSSLSRTLCESEKQFRLCTQVHNCSNLSAEDVIGADPSFSFPVYSAVYAIAHALHNVLQCGAGICNDNITVYPYLVQAELMKSNFTLLNQSIQFDENGDPRFGYYSIVFWNESGIPQEIGFYSFYASSNFFINNTLIKWFTDGEVPTSVCSPECSVGFAKEPDAIHKCCFICEMCAPGTYINTTENPYDCIECAETEWSTEASTSCNLRLVEYIRFTDSAAILIMVGALVLVGITLAMSVLFAINYNTPVVRSAGGPMCFLILGCLGLSSVSVFFYIDKPTFSFCILRYFPFFLFYTVCIACFVVRSFQIVCIFTISAKFPNAHSWWIKYHGQWLVITVISVTQALFLVIGYSQGPPKPIETLWYPDKILLECDMNMRANYAPITLLVLLCSLCFVFSYMGKDLPKNYNEAKVITFCLVLLIFTWVLFGTYHNLTRGNSITTLNAVAVLFSLYCFLLWYFLPKCYIIIFQPHKNTQQYFQGLIQNYTKNN